MKISPASCKKHSDVCGERNRRKRCQYRFTEVRLALLEADVNFKVVKDFVATVKERCLGSEVLESLTPGQMVVKIVNEELTKLMGNRLLNRADKPPTIVMMVGLQGSEKQLPWPSWQIC